MAQTDAPQTLTDKSSTETLSPETASPETSAVTVAERRIPTRRISFEESLAQMPKHYAGDGDLITSHLGAALSSVFPDGEDFFVKSVRHYRDKITDPQLKLDVAGFIGQEAMHGREHRAFNERLDQLGYGTKRVERFTKAGLEFRWKHAPKMSSLATTAALEHFTATLAELVLTNQEIRDQFGHEAVRELFEWHALEECEHKAVAFDVYRAVGGTERMRIWTMNFIRYGFIAGMILQVTISLLQDRETYRRGKLRQSWKRFRQSPLVDKAIWQQLKAYSQPGFHPNDINTDDIVAEWSAKLFGAEGTLNDKLVGSAA